MLQRVSRLLSKPGVLILLTGCTTLPSSPPSPAPASPPSLSSERLSFEHAVHFTPDSAVMALQELHLLDTFLGSLPSRTTARVSLLASAAPPSGNSRVRALATQRLSTVARAVRASLGPGVDIQAETDQAGADVSGPATYPNTVQASVTINVVHLPYCPDHSRDADAATDSLNLPLSSLGCANTGNLGLMLADPDDLRQGRALGRADGVREAGAISRYETDKVKVLPKEGGQP